MFFDQKILLCRQERGNYFCQSSLSSVVICIPSSPFWDWDTPNLSISKIWVGAGFCCAKGTAGKFAPKIFFGM